MQAFTIGVLPVTPFQQNCTILTCTRTHRAIVVDPGGDLEKIEQAIEKMDARVEKIWLTHGHIDHIGAAAPLARKLGVPIEGSHRADQFLFDSVNEVARAYGLPPIEAFTPDRWLEEGETVEIGELKFDVLHCPGHSPGSVAFVWRAQPGQNGPKLAIVGDVLFRGAIGRTDLPGGSHETLLQSIRTKLLTLPDDTIFLCGHGPSGTIGQERRTNPFLVSSHPSD